MRGCGQSRADGGTVAIRDARDDVKRRIIISSSDAQFLLFARHVFAREGFDTVLSVDCETALSLCRVQPPAALLTDCGASGAVALCEAVKANTMTQQTLFVALVEPGQDDDVLAYVNAGADAVFVKPSIRSALLRSSGLLGGPVMRTRLLRPCPTRSSNMTTLCSISVDADVFATASRCSCHSWSSIFLPA